MLFYGVSNIFPWIICWLKGVHFLFFIFKKLNQISHKNQFFSFPWFSPQPTHNYLNKSIKITPNLKILAMQSKIRMQILVKKKKFKIIKPLFGWKHRGMHYLFFILKKLDFEPKTSISYIFPNFSLEPNQKPKKIPIQQYWWFQIRVFENKKTRSTQQKPRKK